MPQIEILDELGNLVPEKVAMDDEEEDESDDEEEEVELLDDEDDDEDDDDYEDDDMLGTVDDRSGNSEIKFWGT